MARLQGKAYAPALKKVVVDALRSLLDRKLPETKDPVTRAHFVDMESLDPDAVVLTVKYLNKRPHVSGTSSPSLTAGTPGTRRGLIALLTLLMGNHKPCHLMENHKVE